MCATRAAVPYGYPATARLTSLIYNVQLQFRAVKIVTAIIAVTIQQGLWQGTRTVPLPPSHSQIPRSYVVRTFVRLSLFIVDCSIKPDYRSYEYTSNNWCRVQFDLESSIFESTPSNRVLQLVVLAAASFFCAIAAACTVFAIVVFAIVVAVIAVVAVVLLFAFVAAVAATAILGFLRFAARLVRLFAIFRRNSFVLRPV